MPGLLEQGMEQPQGVMQQPPAAGPPQGQMPPGAQAPTQPPPGQPQAQGAKNRQPFSKREFDIFVANGTKMIYSEKISDQIISQVVDAKNPVVAIAEVTLAIISRLEQSAKAAGKNPSYETLIYGGNALMGEVIESAEAAGMKKLTKPERYEALNLAVGKYIDQAIKTGQMTKDELMKLAEDAQQTEMGQKMNRFVSGKMSPEELAELKKKNTPEGNKKEIPKKALKEVPEEEV